MMTEKDTEYLTWQDQRTNTSVLEKAQSTSIESMIIRHRLCWAGHLVPMDDKCIEEKVTPNYNKDTDMSAILC